MKNLKTIGAIFCTALLSLALCGEALASSKKDKTTTTTETTSKKDKHHGKDKNNSSTTSNTGEEKTKPEHKPTLPDGLSETNKYDVTKYEVEAGDTLQVTLKGNTYKCILFGVEVPQAWDAETSKEELKKILTTAKSIKMQVFNGKAKSKTRIGINPDSDSDKDSPSGSGRGATEGESAPNRNLLVKLSVGNSDIGKLMIQKGYAKCYDAEIDIKGMGGTEYAQAQKQAQSKKLGLWKEE